MRRIDWNAVDASGSQPFGYLKSHSQKAPGTVTVNLHATADDKVDRIIY
jgi:hypothetical protein